MGSEGASRMKAVLIGKLVDAVMINFPKAGQGTRPACYARKSIEQRLVMMFPVFRIPDHPPYSLMIEQAIAKLNEEGGSSEESISMRITGEYDLPWAHASFLSHHLKKLRDREEIIYTRDKRYMLPFNANGSIPPDASKEKFKRGRGRNHGMHMQNKRSKTERSPESQNLIDEQKSRQQRTETVVSSEKNGALCLSVTDLDGDQTPQQPERLINLLNSELATKESTHVKENEEDSLSRSPQRHGTEEEDQVAEDPVHGIDEPMEERVKVSDKQYTSQELILLEQELHVPDHAESDDLHDQQPGVILAQQDQVEAQPVGAKDAEEPIGPRESPQLEVFCQQILMRQKEIEELVEHLKQNMEADGNGVIPREKCWEFLRRNKAMELVFMEMLEPSPESSTGIIDHSLTDGKAGASFEAVHGRRLCQTNGILHGSVTGAAR